MSHCCSLCPWVGWRVHHNSAAPPKPWWTSSIYTPLPPGTHHSILWNPQQEHNPCRMVGTASPSQHPHSLHHHDYGHHQNFPCPSNTTTADHWHMAMSSLMTKFCSPRAHQTTYTSLSTRLSTSMIGSSGPTITMTIQQSVRSPSPKANFRRGGTCWSTTKVILSLTLDTLQGTIKLPAHQKTCLQVILTDALQCKHGSVRAWQKLLGDLRSMVLGIPGLQAPGRPSTPSQQPSLDPQGSEGMSTGPLHPCPRPGTVPYSNG